MSDGKIKRYDRVAADGVRKCISRRVVAFGVGDAINPSQGVTDILNIGVIS